MLEHHLNRLTLAGYRPRTIYARRALLTAFAAHMQRPLSEATRLDVESFLSRPLSSQTRHTYLQHLRGFYRWAADEGLCQDPTVKVASVRVRKGTPRPIDSDALALAIHDAPARMRAWLLLMSHAGLRCCEVAPLRPIDVLDGKVPLLYLREVKGGGSATVPAHPLVLDALASLPVRNGLWWDVTPHHVTVQVSRYFRERGVAATAHQLRHFAGTSWYRASHDLLAVKALLRHASVASTEVYAGFDPTRPAEVVNLVPQLRAV